MVNVRPENKLNVLNTNKWENYLWFDADNGFVIPYRELFHATVNGRISVYTNPKVLSGRVMQELVLGDFYRALRMRYPIAPTAPILLFYNVKTKAWMQVDPEPSATDLKFLVYQNGVPFMEMLADGFQNWDPDAQSNTLMMDGAEYLDRILMKVCNLDTGLEYEPYYEYD